MLTLSACLETAGESKTCTGKAVFKSYEKGGGWFSVICSVHYFGTQLVSPAWSFNRAAAVSMVICQCSC